ncbi:hypothetical protein F5884DRAFT_772840 [Xylogone sp. PMI_703]|nr:hypothetical protein F5884DRAFT_772840 [Xylogone sp. PMI_703]
MDPICSRARALLLCLCSTYGAASTTVKKLDSGASRHASCSICDLAVYLGATVILCYCTSYCRAGLDQLKMSLAV